MKKMSTRAVATAVAAALGTEARRWEKNQMVRYYLTPAAIQRLGGGRVTASTRAYVETAPVPHIGTWDVQHADVLASALEALAATAPATAPADPAPATEPAAQPAQSPWAILRAWASEAALATRPAWRYSRVDVDVAIGCVSIRLYDGTGRGDDWAVVQIAADGTITRSGKNGACVRLLPDVTPQAVIDAAQAVLRAEAARLRRETEDDVIDTPAAYSGGYDASDDGDDYEVIAAHMREARRGRRAYDRW